VEAKNQSIRLALLKIEARARSAAIGVTAAIVLGAIAWHYASTAARSVMADMPPPQIVLKPGYQFLIDGHSVQVVGNDVCPSEEDPQKAYWPGGRPAVIPERGCVVVGPTTSSVRVLLSNGVYEVWAIKHQEHNGFPATLIQRQNGEYVTDAK